MISRSKRNGHSSLESRFDEFKRLPKRIVVVAVAVIVVVVVVAVVVVVQWDISDVKKLSSKQNIQ